jgi:hypothetical protein
MLVILSAERPYSFANRCIYSQASECEERMHDVLAIIAQLSLSPVRHPGQPHELRTSLSSWPVESFRSKVVQKVTALSANPRII